MSVRGRQSKGSFLGGGSGLVKGWGGEGGLGSVIEALGLGGVLEGGGGGKPRPGMCVCVCVCIYTYVCMYVCMCMCMCMYVYMHMYVYI